MTLLVGHAHHAALDVFGVAHRRSTDEVDNLSGRRHALAGCLLGGTRLAHAQVRAFVFPAARLSLADALRDASRPER